MTVVREPTQVFELFLKGDLDWHGLALPEYWYEKLPDDHELVKNGHVGDSISQRCTPADLGGTVEFKSSGLSNQDIRVDELLNFSAVIEKCFRNDYERMRTVADGYGPRSHPDLKARAFGGKAKEQFAKAGYTELGPDGT